ncbi:MULTISPECIES: hypothetical protein [Micromonospora]|uniref:hypothetical protein n=1 Tax=Micromonospora TaxID=1873 RepID=UPI0011CD8ABC|nr:MULTISPECIES: hypothetical protein [Micromonospora]NES17284.1 hypothetical protein [Micromonospora sp. PPF5-17B]NES39636.1 hypothetical protein [Micromonospora solifontis]NES59108.1 hypothetical protein [Micromonospora sp. PPF5-6]
MATFEIGDVIEVDDRDYRYGTGPLILRVTRIGQRQRAADGEWLDLEGLELRPDGTQIRQQPRPVSVRLGGVRLRPGGPHYRP